MELIFCMQITIQLFYKFVLSVLVGMVSHSQSTQNNKIAIFLHYLKKEVRNEVDVFVQVNIKDFYMFILSYFLVWPGMPKVLKKEKQKTFFMGLTKHAQSTSTSVQCPWDISRKRLGMKLMGIIFFTSQSKIVANDYFYL